jgi:hypothetical protein
MNDLNVDSVEGVIDSALFLEICNQFYNNYFYLFTKLNFELNVEDFINLTRSLFIDKDIYKSNKIKDNHDYLYDIYNSLYDYWRKLRRYAILQKNFSGREMSRICDTITLKILTLYRKITERLKETKYLVYRKLPAFCNVIFSTGNPSKISKLNYNCLSINKILIVPPFIINTQNNKRVKNFTLTTSDITKDIVVDDNFLSYLIYVGNKKTIIYCHKKYAHHLISLSNLFEAINPINYKINVDIVLFIGCYSSFDRCIYRDSNGIYYGILGDNEENDYFGYVKKILLTMHNMIVIDKGYLPIHGCGFEIELKNGSKKNICLVGDSGVGKSETLEALRRGYRDEIVMINIVFDDMGYLILDKKEITFSGTEIGAFIRLDDLERGYAYDQMDRCIFINPNKENARIVMPINDYKSVTSKYHLDAIFYVNNYDLTDGIKYFQNKKDLIDTFVEGRRISKNTTWEKGLVSTFFSNPFGPLQKQEATRKLIDKYFNIIYNSLPNGQIYTKLGLNIDNKESLDLAAKYLIEFIKK